MSRFALSRLRQIPVKSEVGSKVIARSTFQTNMVGCRSLRQFGIEQVSKPFRSLSQDLVRMPPGSEHHAADRFDVFVGHVFVEKIAHGIYKDHARLTLTHWIDELFWDDAKVKPVFEGMCFDTAKPFRKCLRIAVLQPGFTFEHPRTGFKLRPSIQFLIFRSFRSG